MNGDYRIQSEIVDDKGNVTYGTVQVIYICVMLMIKCLGGNFITQTRYSHSGLFTNGILEVKGFYSKEKFIL